jgi:hypothetical protein
MNKELTFKDVYMPPFYVGGFKIYGFSKNGTKTFTAFGDVAQSHMFNIVDILNGESSEKYNKKDVTVEKDKLYIKGNLIMVRGWRKLTGTSEGCYHLNHADAAKLQDKFIQWVVDTITED